MLSSEWDWTTKKSIRLQQGNTIQILHGRLHQHSRSPEEEIEVFNHLQPLHSQYGFELKKWRGSNEAVTEAFPEDLKSISKTKHVELESNTEESSVLGLQWTVTDDSLHICK